VPQIRWPLPEPLLRAVPVAAEPAAVPAIDPGGLALSTAPGVVAALLAVITAFSRRRRPQVTPAEVIVFWKELPQPRAA
jgi:hypothetical protein